ncbi:E2 family protein E [Variovorax sp. YR750]|uniref:E2/UBC family protein n=2 Tax=Pseudomonadota TaxID=1224 RepID=UPI0008D8428D|nr:E2/UBC family protein [Variovorax sp. YR750]SEM15098.1 E2 family protein E [Variovorax sp. YR750]
MSLPASDISYLDERGLPYSVTTEGGMICVLLPQFPLPAGSNVTASDLLLRLNPGFPDVPPDMWWFDPPVTRNNGATIQATEAREQHLGRTWQRWSRHLQPGQWRSGVDRLENFIGLIRAELMRGCGSATV